MSTLLNPIIASLSLLTELSQPAPAPLVTREMIRSAVAAELAEQRSEREAGAAPPEAGRFSAQTMSERERQRMAFEATMKQAEVPFCLHQDGLKHQPTRIGFIGVGGVLALPFIPIAALRGKCKW